MKGVNTFLMFNDQAEEAVRFYTSAFPRSRLVDLLLSEGEPGIPAGKVHIAVFEIGGQEFYACDGGPDFEFSMGTSIWINCENQKEIDQISDALIQNGGAQLDCGWVKDRFGMFWQIVPAGMRDMMLSDDRASAKRVNAALLKMKRLDVAALERAARGEPATAGR
jgi:predicted 3-demethylubiquinone-9 3-methyltransferase (glyoxalase superfamily)